MSPWAGSRVGETSTRAMTSSGSPGTTVLTAASTVWRMAAKRSVIGSLAFGAGRRSGLRPETRQRLCPWTPAKGEALCNLSIGWVYEEGRHGPCKAAVGPPHTQNQWFQGPLLLAGFQGAAPLGG